MSENKDQNKKPKSPSDLIKAEEEARKKKTMEDGGFDENGIMYIKLTTDDSALIVHSDGTVEMVSHDLEKSKDGYVGDVEDLNKTFSLVLALASALENEDLYNRIFHNLNMTLMQRWEDIPDDVKDDIVEHRKEKNEKQTDVEREEKTKRVDEFRKRMNMYKNKFIDDEKKKLMDDLAAEADFREQYSDDFTDPPRGKEHMMEKFEEHMEHMDRESRKEKPKIKKRKRNPLAKLIGIDWNPYDKTLVAKKGQWRLDYPPAEEEDE